jgi:hypothetical protein
MRQKRRAASKQPVRRRDVSVAPTTPAPKKLLADLRQLIEKSRRTVAQTVNTALVWLYWTIGKRIRDDLLKQARADYGERIVATLSQELTAEYGRGFGARNLFRMVRFAEVFPDEQIVSSLVTQLSWTHFIYIIPLDDPRLTLHRPEPLALQNRALKEAGPWPGRREGQAGQKATWGGPESRSGQPGGAGRGAHAQNGRRGGRPRPRSAQSIPWEAMSGEHAHRPRAGEPSRPALVRRPFWRAALGRSE